MKKIIVLTLIATLIFSVFMWQAKAVETTLFSDDFESYAVGAFPSTGGWELVWNGMGDQYQVITDAFHVSPTKSLQLWGNPNDWSAVVQKHFSSSSRFLGYELSMMVSAVGSGGPGRSDYVGFFNKEAYIWGKHYASILFNHDSMNIITDDNSVVGTWTPGVWYNIKVLLDRDTNTYSVWIDGQLKGTTFPTHNTDTNIIDAMQLQSDHPGVKDYFDDVRVFEGEAPSPTPLTASISPLSTSINVGNSVTFTSAVSGGTTPYSYQWYLDSNPVSGATSASWTFTPSTSGIYYVYLRVTDSSSNTTQSETARVTVASVPVGGYSISIEGQKTTKHLSSYLAFVAILALSFIVIRRKTTKDEE